MILLQIELAGIDSYGAALYCGTGCFHRRESLCGKKYNKDFNESVHLNVQTNNKLPKTADALEEACKRLVDCNFENGSQWGNEVYLYLSRDFSWRPPQHGWQFYAVGCMKEKLH